MPRVTFIVSCYDRPLALRLCLSSLVLQTEREWEAIVCDNSKDHAVQARHYGFSLMDPRIRYVHTNAIDSYYSAEMVIGEATGDFVAFPSDDSFYTCHYLKKMLWMADNHNLELVYSDIVMDGPTSGGVLSCEARVCMIDKTNFLLKRERFIPFPAKNPEGMGSCSDGELIDELVRQGIRHGKVPHPICVHV